MVNIPSKYHNQPKLPFSFHERMSLQSRQPDGSGKYALKMKSPRLCDDSAYIYAQCLRGRGRRVSLSSKPVISRIVRVTWRDPFSKNQTKLCSPMIMKLMHWAIYISPTWLIILTSLAYSCLYTPKPKVAGLLMTGNVLYEHFILLIFYYVCV